MRLAHVSDLHFGAIESGRPGALRRALEQVAPDLLVVSGDLSQRGTEAEMREAMEFLKTLPQPQFIVPGNHDIPHGHHLWARFKQTWRTYKKVVAADLEPVWQNDAVAIIGANSVRAGGWYLDWSRGHLSGEQLRRIAACCEQIPEHLLRVLVVHHPPAAPPQGTRRHLLDRRKRFFSALNEAGVDLVMCGHFHMSYAVPLMLPGNLRRACVLSVASTATSYRLEGEPNGFHVIDVPSSQNRMDIQAWRWEQQQGAFKPASEWSFQRHVWRHWTVTRESLA